MILNGEPLEEVDCFKYMGSQVAADRGCESDVVPKMNEGYRAWGSLKSVLSIRVLGIKAKKCLHEEVENVNVKSSIARSLPMENLLIQNVGSIIN